MNWLTLVLALVRVAEIILNWVRNKQQIDVGVDRAIARASASILAKTRAGKEVMEKVTAMTPEQVDAELLKLEQEATRKVME